MSTKNNPGKYDCYSKADPDEPMFVLLARDRHAPAVLRLWIKLRVAEGEAPAVLQEAERCIDDMIQWRKDNH
jgi:hypothetical protein